MTIKTTKKEAPGNNIIADLEARNENWAVVDAIGAAVMGGSFTVVDDTNGKTYKWSIKSSNGVPSIELEEV